MDWKQQAWLWFTRAAQFWLAQTLLIFLWACIVAGGPVGPKNFVRFNYWVIQWQPARTTVTPAAYLSQKFGEPHEEPQMNERHLNFMENR
jgi:hypothetical protein